MRIQGEALQHLTLGVASCAPSATHNITPGATPGASPAASKENLNRKCI
jgi:hypothetical protein